MPLNIEENRSHQNEAFLRNALKDGLREEILAEWNKAVTPSRSPYIKPDLRGADLKGLPLTGISLYGCDLRGADLHGTDFTDANLAHADLRTCQAVDTRFRSALMYNANLRDANCRKSDFWNVGLNDARGLDSANFTGAKGAAISYPPGITVIAANDAPRIVYKGDQNLDFWTLFIKAEGALNVSAADRIHVLAMVAWLHEQALQTEGLDSAALGIVATVSEEHRKAPSLFTEIYDAAVTEEKVPPEQKAAIVKHFGVFRP